MMLESIGMVRPKVDGFFAFRGPVETTIEDPDSSDAGPRTKRPTKRKQAGSSPLSTAKGSSKSGKGSSSLAVMENANDSTSELSEMDDKPKASKPSASSGLANSSTVPGENAGATDGGAGSATTTPTKKKSGLSRSKSAKDVTKEGAEASKDSDKDSKSGTGKKAKAKPSKAAAAAAASTATSAVTTPIVRVDSPPPSDNPTDSSAPPPAAPSRSSSPSRSKSKAKAPATTEVDPTSIGTGTGDVEMPAATAELSSGEGVSPTSETAKASAADSTVKSATSSEATNKSKTSKTLEPLNEDVQTAYTIVADLARKETWEVKARFPPHIKAPLFDCAKIALTTRSSGYVLEDNFFFHLQQVLPYNKFTLKKLIYKNVLPKWISDLEAQKTRLIEQFTTRVNIVWKSSGLADQPDKDGDGDVNMNEEGKPTKRFPWTQDLRLLLWETMEKFMEILAARQEFRTIDESQPAPFSDSKTRKDAYQTLLQSFPAGCMSSYEISRQYSQLKEKVQKQEKKETESSSSTASAGKPRPVFSSSSGSKGGGTATAARSAPVPSSGASGTRVATSTPAPATTPAAAPTSTSSPATQSTTTAASTSSTTSPPAAATHAPSSETPRDQSHMSSPSKSPSVVPRTASLSEIVHPTPQQPRQQHAAFVSEPMIGNGTSAANRKRKKSEEDITHGHGPGSHHNIPIKAEIPSYEEVISAHSYRHVGGSASEYPPPSSSPSMSPSNRAMYSSMMTEAAKKKRPQDQRQPSVPSSSGHITHHPVSTSGPYHPGARETMYHPRRPQSPPQAYSSHSSRVYPPPSQSSPHHHHYHHEPPPLSHHHRIASPGGSPSGSGAYSSGPAHPSSRPMTLPTGAQSSSVSPPSKAMSMSNLLHHPPSHHSRQGPM
ncbi:hypothetical protein B0O80DRAFT_94994 [Mortierella sp. GBAus27b]|nr:hypothetical protein B0O80DRAFT_94994 [Mortierella sp. GBAus27b]